MLPAGGLGAGCFIPWGHEPQAATVLGTFHEEHTHEALHPSENMRSHTETHTTLHHDCRFAQNAHGRRPVLGMRA